MNIHQYRATIPKKGKVKKETKTKKSKHMESELQTKVCKELRKHYPNLVFFSDFAAGLKMSDYMCVLRSLQACEGKYLDLTILEPSGIYHGLIIEIKCTKSDLFLVDGVSLGSDHVQEQFNMVKRLRTKGYYADFGVGYDDIMGMIEDYINFGGRQYKPIKERVTKLQRELEEQNRQLTDMGV